MTQQIWPQNGILYSFAVTVKKSLEPCMEWKKYRALRSVLRTKNAVRVNQKIRRDAVDIFIFKLAKINISQHMIEQHRPCTLLGHTVQRERRLPSEWKLSEDRLVVHQFYEWQLGIERHTNSLAIIFLQKLYGIEQKIGDPHMQGHDFDGMFICMKDFTNITKRFNIQRSDGRGKSLYHHHDMVHFFLFCFLYLEYNVGKNTMTAHILPDTINPNLHVRNIIVLHNFRFQVGLFTWLFNICSTKGWTINLRLVRSPYRLLQHTI
jgi:hypothetical protein